MDNAIYIMSEEGEVLILALYVDDMLLIGNNMNKINEVKEYLKRKFTMTDLGEAETILGIGLRRNRAKGLLCLEQRNYCQKILRRFSMEKCSNLGTPLQPGEHLSCEEEPHSEGEKEEMEKVPYREAVGSLMYLMVSTRPDLAAAVGIVSRFFNNPGRKHWEAVKKVFRYLQKTKNLGLVFRKKSLEDFILFGYSDADWGTCKDTHRSVTGYVFQLGAENTITWQSKRQGTVALSTAEAETMAAVQAAKEGIWISDFMMQLKVKVGLPLKIFVDNKSAIQILKNPVSHYRTKHMGIQTQFVRELVEDEIFEFQYVPTELQVADVLTKALAPVKMEKALKMLGLVEIKTN